KTIFLLISLLYLSYSETNAQFKTLAEGPIFKEPVSGQVKILLLQNGNTIYFYFQILKHYKISFTLYNSDHKVVREDVIPLTDPDKDIFIGDALDINNDVLLVFYTYENYRKTPIRIIIDGKTGIIKGLENKPKLVVPLAGMTEKNGLLPGINVSEAPSDKLFTLQNQSENSYSFVSLSRNKATKSSKLKVVTFNKEQKEVGNNEYPLEQSGLEFYDIFDSKYVSPDKICLLIRGSNKKRDDIKDSKLFFLILDVNKNSKSIFNVEHANDLITVNGNFCFNPVSNVMLIHFVLENDSKKDKLLTSNLTAFSMVENKFVYTKQINLNTVIEQSINEFGKSVGNINTPQDLFVNQKDGSFQILYEKVEVKTSGYSNGSYSSKTNLGNIAILSFDKNGNETGNSIIPKDQSEEGEIYMYHDFGVNNGFQYAGTGNQFKSYAYFNGAGSPYIFINDIPDNAESVKKGKLTTIDHVGRCFAYYYHVSQNGVLTDRNFFFDQSDKDNSLGLFTASYYDEKRNILATLRVFPNGKNE
ncbi:MAG: hypothetical protein ABUT20_63885, partial [Bacteroidota bacterium]